MIFGSVCSGIGAPEVAWGPLGWRCAFTSEIEPFPSALLATRFPGVPNLGDLTKFKEWPNASIDLLVGGTPCQAFSVAGRREGFTDARGNLTLTFLDLVARLRPRWLVWENVPGVLSLDGGRTFGTILGKMAQLGYGWAYRVLDAQYFGVPQRRRRVFVVGHLGDWRPAAAVLFEPESLRGDSPPRRQAGEGVAPTISARTKGGGGFGTDFDRDGGLIGAFNNTGQGWWCDADTAQAVRKGDDAGGGGARESTLVAFTCKDHGSDAGDLAPTLRAMGHAGSHPNAGGQVAIAVSLRGREGGGSAELTEGAMPALRACQGGGDKPHVLTSAVRRLTPRECERLQGFPDDWTLVAYRGKLAADGPRYKVIGNSMAVPVMQWIGERIAAEAQKEARLSTG